MILKSALMLLVNPLMVFSGLYVYSYFKNKAKYITATLNKARDIERNKDAIKRCPVTFLTHFYVI